MAGDVSPVAMFHLNDHFHTSNERQICQVKLQKFLLIIDCFRKSNPDIPEAIAEEEWFQLEPSPSVFDVELFTCPECIMRQFAAQNKIRFQISINMISCSLITEYDSGKWHHPSSPKGKSSVRKSSWIGIVQITFTKHHEGKGVLFLDFKNNI